VGGSGFAGDDSLLNDGKPRVTFKGLSLAVSQVFDRHGTPVINSVPESRLR
jgi:hypothetical protein